MRLPLVVALLALVSCAQPVVEKITPAQVNDLVTTGALLLDVRTPEEFAQGHLEGAQNINYYSPTFAADVSALDTSTPYVVYCGSGKRSHNATVLMQQLGFRELYDLENGVTAWKAAGLPLVCEPTTCPAG